jgi:hypothetical protein
MTNTSDKIIIDEIRILWNNEHTARIPCERDGILFKAVQLWQLGDDHIQTAPTITRRIPCQHLLLFPLALLRAKK